MTQNPRCFQNILLNMSVPTVLTLAEGVACFARQASLLVLGGILYFFIFLFFFYKRLHREQIRVLFPVADDGKMLETLKQRTQERAK